ncbi:CU044_5270 family protein [Actinomadura sp. NTSP31]|uniref:CU044_5270 family protein n=1 Tax=Actinomadura sp. NTSP31 TaxID=1735447 RepID=UPI0035C04823
MNDLDILRDTWAEPAPPSGAARASARAALLERAAGSRPEPRPARRVRLRLPRPAVRLVAVGVLAAAVAVGVTVVQSGGTDGHGRPRPVLPGIPAGPVANASEALERAAQAAERRPFTPPRPDQWVYVESRVRRGDTPNGPVSKGRTLVTRDWKRADGEKVAGLEHGKIVFADTMPTTPPSDYASLAAMPTAPDALLRWLYQQMGGLGDTAEGRYETAYSMLGAVLRDNLLPPKTEAAVFRALKQIPGVTLARAPVQGRPALALARLEEGWLHEELMLDPNTYRYLGEQSVAVKNHTDHGDDGNLAVKKGDVLNMTIRLKTAIVDAPGQQS